MSRFFKRLLLLLTTLGAAAATYTMMRAEGERALRRVRRAPSPLPPFEPSKESRKPGPTLVDRPAPAPEPDPSRCSAIKKSGERCSREPQPGSLYCWQHG
jgi:hypothetical protein